MDDGEAVDCLQTSKSYSFIWMLSFKTTHQTATYPHRDTLRQWQELLWWQEAALMMGTLLARVTQEAATMAALVTRDGQQEWCEWCLWGG